MSNSMNTLEVRLKRKNYFVRLVKVTGFRRYFPFLECRREAVKTLPMGVVPPAAAPVRHPAVPDAANEKSKR